MKRLILALLFIFVVTGIVYSAGENSTRGNTEPIRAEFKRFYIDSFSVKATLSKTIAVPGGGWGYNLLLYVSGPATQEESLKASVSINTIWGVEHHQDSVRKYLIVTELGEDNQFDSLTYNGRFTEFTLSPSTNTAGASAAESVMTVIYSFQKK